MKLNYAYFFPICLAFGGCTHGGEAAPTSTTKNSVDTFYREHFGKADELDSDCLKIKSIDVTVHRVHEMVSHGTDFQLISDDRTGGIFVVPIHRGYFIQFLPPALILSSLKGSDERVIANSMELGLEAFMNQSSRLSDAPLSYDELDSILTFNSRERWSRIKSEFELDSAYAIITRGVEGNDDQEKILDLLKARFQAGQILLYNDSDNHLEAFIIEPSIPLSKRDEGKFPLQLNNVIHCQVGFDKRE